MDHHQLTDTRQWYSCFVGFNGITSFWQKLIDSSTGELEMNFGEYEFVYPDGEVDTTPTTGESVECSESDHLLL